MIVSIIQHLSDTPMGDTNLSMVWNPSVGTSVSLFQPLRNSLEWWYEHVINYASELYW